MERPKVLTKQLVVRVPRDLLEALRADADANGRTVAQSVRRCAHRTYTLDAEKDGHYMSDYGLTADQIAAARINAPRLGITILAVIEEVAVSPADLAPFGITL